MACVARLLVVVAFLAVFSQAQVYSTEFEIVPDQEYSNFSFTGASSSVVFVLNTTKHHDLVGSNKTFVFNITKAEGQCNYMTIGYSPVCDTSVCDRMLCRYMNSLYCWTNRYDFIGTTLATNKNYTKVFPYGIDTNTYSNPNPSALNSCGCSKTATNGAVWFFGLSNRLDYSGGAACNVTFHVSAVDVCNSNGYYDYDAAKCVCNGNWIGKYCSSEMKPLTLGVPSTQTLSTPSSTHVFTFDINRQNYNITFHKQGVCTGGYLVMRVGASCNSTKCVRPSYNVAADTRTYFDGTGASVWRLSGVGDSVYYKGWLYAATNFECSCDKVYEESWFVEMTSSTPCTYSVEVSSQGDLCNGRGTYNLQQRKCDCNVGYTGSFCESAATIMQAGVPVTYRVRTNSPFYYSYNSVAKEHLNFTMVSAVGSQCNIQWYMQKLCNTTCQAIGDLQIVNNPPTGKPFSVRQVYGDQLWVSSASTARRSYTPEYNCGCNQTDQTFVGYFSSYTQVDCTVTFRVDSVPVCSGHGYYNYSTGVCSCDEGWSTYNCSVAIQKLTTDGPVRATTQKGKVSYFTYGFRNSTDAYVKYDATFTAVSGDCSTMKIASYMACNYGQVRGCDPTTAYEYTWGTETSAFPAHAIVDQHSLYKNPCECGTTPQESAKKVKNPMYKVVSLGGDCVYDVALSVTNSCFNCTGTCNKFGQCECAAGRSGLSCDDTTPRTREIYHTRQKKGETKFDTNFRPGEVLAFWVQVGPTNSEVEVSFDMKMAADANFLGSVSKVTAYYSYVDPDEGGVMPSIQTNGSVGAFPFMSSKVVSGVGQKVVTNLSQPLVIKLTGDDVKPAPLWVYMALDANYVDAMWDSNPTYLAQGGAFVHVEPLVRIKDKYSLIIVAVGSGLMGVVVIALVVLCCRANNPNSFMGSVVPKFIGDDVAQAELDRAKVLGTKKPTGPTTISLNVMSSDPNDDEDGGNNYNNNNNDDDDGAQNNTQGLYDDDDDDEENNNSNNNGTNNNSTANGNGTNNNAANTTEPPPPQGSAIKDFAAVAGGAASDYAQEQATPWAQDKGTKAYANYNKNKKSNNNSSSTGSTQRDRDFGTYDKPEKPDISISCKFLMVIPVIAIAVGQFLVDVLRVMFNVLLINTSLHLVAPDLPSIPKLRLAIPDFVDFLGSVYDIMDKALETFDVVKKAADNWNCGGAVSMFSPYVVLIATVILYIILKRDLLLWAFMAAKRYAVAKSHNKLVKMLAAQISTLMVAVLFYGLQIAITVIAQVVAKVLSVHVTCGDQDAIALLIGRIYAFAVMVIMGIYLLFVFTGNPPQPPANSEKIGDEIAHVCVFGVFSIFKLVLGIWDSGLTISHRIKYKSKLWDDDDTDEDTQHEAVIGITAKSKSLFFLAIPGCALIAKFTEAVNNPPIFVLDPELELDTGRNRRIFLWLRHVIEFGLTIAASLSASYVAFALMLASLIPKFLDNALFAVIKLFKNK